MKVYFTASIVGKKHYLTDYLKIIELLKSWKHEVKADHIINTSPDQIRIEKLAERLVFHKKLEGWITASDCMVAEVSFPSISVGYEISLGLHKNKSVLLLYKEGYPPSLFDRYHEDRLICERYTTGQLSQIIEDFLQYVEGANDTRFTFFITPQINAFLEEISKKKKTPKSVYLRSLIEREMIKDLK